jgi:heme A synthase
LAFKSDTALGVWSVGPITMEAEAVNVVHRYLAYLVAGLIMALGIRLKRRVGNAALTWIRIAAGLTVLQILLGIANLYSDLSFVSVIPHLAVASWMLAAMVMVVVRLSAPDDTQGAEQPGFPRGANVRASA